MARMVFRNAGIDFLNPVIDLSNYDFSSFSSTRARVDSNDDNGFVLFGGNGFTGTASGIVTGGTITSITVGAGSSVNFTVTGISISAVAFQRASLSSRTNDDAAIIEDMLSGRDIITGSRFADRLGGYDGNDFIKSGAGNDEVVGGDGRDVVFAGAGNDFVSGDDGNDVLLGESGHDILIGGDGIDSLRGGTGNDIILGGDSTDIIRGEGGNDRIDGGDGRNLIYTGTGVDTIVFNDLPSGGFNRIVDYSGSDALEFENTAFRLASGDIRADQFQLGKRADDASDRFIYDRDFGILRYDADGNGGGTAVIVAQFINKPLLTFSDFEMI